MSLYLLYITFHEISNYKIRSRDTNYYLEWKSCMSYETSTIYVNSSCRNTSDEINKVGFDYQKVF